MYSLRNLRYQQIHTNMFLVPYKSQVEAVFPVHVSSSTHSFKKGCQKLLLNPHTILLARKRLRFTFNNIVVNRTFVTHFRNFEFPIQSSFIIEARPHAKRAQLPRSQPQENIVRDIADSVEEDPHFDETA